MKSNDFNFLEGFLTEPLWDRKKLAELLDTTPEVLAVWDSTKRYDLKPIKVGAGVRYCPVYIRYFYGQKYFSPEQNNSIQQLIKARN